VYFAFGKSRVRTPIRRRLTITDTSPGPSEALHAKAVSLCSI